MLTSPYIHGAMRNLKVQSSLFFMLMLFILYDVEPLKINTQSSHLLTQAILIRTTVSNRLSHSKFELFQSYRDVDNLFDRMVLLVDMHDQQHEPVWIRDSGLELFKYHASKSCRGTFGSNGSEAFPSIDELFPAIMQNLAKWINRKSIRGHDKLMDSLCGAVEQQESIQCHLQRNVNWYIHELSVLLWLHHQSDEAPTYIWVVEDDAWFSGKLSDFFNATSFGSAFLQSEGLDLISSDLHGLSSREDICPLISDDFYGRYQVGRNGCVKHSEQIVRLSKRLLVEIEEALLDDAVAYGEVLAPTICHSSSWCSSGDLRGTSFIATDRCHDRDAIKWGLESYDEGQHPGFSWRCWVTNRTTWLGIIDSMHDGHRAMWYTKVGWCTDKIKFQCDQINTLG